MLFILNFKTWRGGVGLAGCSVAEAFYAAAAGSEVDYPTNDPVFFCAILDFLAGLTPSSSSPESLPSSFLSLAMDSSY